MDEQRLHNIQEALRQKGQQGIDGWLFCDFRGSDPLAYRILGLDPAAIRHAVLAGVRSIEHGTFITEELLELMAERGCALIPTLTVMSAFDPTSAGASLPEMQKRKMAAAVARAGACMRLALTSHDKIQVGSGTDAFGGTMQGKNGEELVWKAQMGLSPMDALVSATKVNAEILGLADKLGTIAASKWADMIVVDGNPLDDVRLFAQPDKVVMVMKEGKRGKGQKN